MFGRHGRRGVLDRQVRQLLGDFPVERGLRNRRPRFGRADDDDDLAPGRPAGGIFGGELVQGAAPHLLVELGQFARDRRGARPKLERKVGERFGEAPRRLVEDERAGHGGERVDPLAAGRRSGREESLEIEAVGRQAGDAKRGERRGSAGAAVTAKPSSTASATSL